MRCKKAIVVVYRDTFVMKFEHNEKMNKKKKLKVAKRLAEIFDADVEILEGVDDLEIIYKDGK